jgi:hypothetical protein
MKSITVIATAAYLLASFAVAGNVSAQDHAASATVPFAFSVGNMWLPAGTYTITSDVGSHFISIRDKERTIALWTVVQTDRRRLNGDNKLVFTKYGDQYFLHEILCPSRGMNVALTGSKHEKLARARQDEAGLLSPTDVYLALKR